MATRLLTKYLVAVLVVFLHYTPQIMVWMSEDERYCDGWGPTQLLGIAAGTLLLAAAALALDAMIERSGSGLLKRLFQHAFLLALVSGVLAACFSFLKERPQTADLLWAVALAAVAGSFFWKRSPLVRWAKTACLIFSPLPLVLLGQMSAWHWWSESPDPLPQARPSDTRGTPVFLFVFDEWSWLRSSDDGQWLPGFVHARELAEQSVVFTKAVSPDRDTMQSLPRFLFQNERTLRICAGGLRFEGEEGDRSNLPRSGPPGAWHKLDQSPFSAPSLFVPARECGYTSYVLGWYHPYHSILDGQVDCCRSYSYGAEEPGWWKQAALVLLENARYWTDPLSRRFGPGLLDRRDSANWRGLGLRYRDDMLKVLADCPAKSVAVFHVPLPHSPYVFNADGSYCGPNPDPYDTAGYLRQLQYVDGLVGQIVATLRAAGKFDESLVVLTSDHGWRFDGEQRFRQVADWDRRVPLMVKLPGQRTGCVMDDDICTNRLLPLLEAAFHGEATTGELLQVLEDCTGPGRNADPQN
jgi:hypothetical protein